MQEHCRDHLWYPQLPLSLLMAVSMKVELYLLYLTNVPSIQHCYKLLKAPACMCQH